ncbi:glycosyltransferase [Dactylosporangium sp. CA-139114]|uniref:glycosyltransferase n=1 Tax=Dactylosporangium sp. CA-139114 TaxID=3239931 RepID=UPI003D98CF08
MLILIPAYEPDDRLTRLLEDLRRDAVDADVVVVDDGSGPAYRAVFAAARQLGATVLTHPANRGKGAALKTGFRHAAARAAPVVVCADADGQHRPRDILAVADAVRRTGRTVLGVRRFTGPVPARSRIGNAVTRTVYTALTGRRVADTQTGLRGYPPGLLGWLQTVPGERFEYEMRALLLAARAGHPIEQVPIATVYLEGNASSHFRPVADSLRVYAPLLRFAVSSLLAAALDTALLLGLHAATGALLPSVLAARAVSATVNFAVNRRAVYPASRGGGRPDVAGAAVRYWLLVVALALANYATLAGLTAVGLPLPAAKLTTDVALFVASYRIQRRFVFAAPAPRPRRPAVLAEPGVR